MTGPTWAEEGDALVRGLAHALSNRVAALSLAADDLADESPDVAAEARARLAGEVERLATIDRLLKLVPGDRAARAQALLPGEVLADALALHAHHLELREVTLRGAADASAPPVRVPRALLLRALVLLLSAGRRAAGGGAVSVTMDGDASALRVVVSPAGDPGEAADLAAAIGGRIELAEGRATMSLPSLQAVRERERPSG